MVTFLAWRTSLLAKPSSALIMLLSDAVLRQVQNAHHATADVTHVHIMLILASYWSINSSKIRPCLFGVRIGVQQLTVAIIFLKTVAMD